MDSQNKMKARIEKESMIFPHWDLSILSDVILRKRKLRGNRGGRVKMKSTGGVFESQI